MNIINQIELNIDIISNPRHYYIKLVKKKEKQQKELKHYKKDIMKKNNKKF